MLGFGRAAREVCALALRRGVCFRHLVSVNYESDDRLYFFATQKALRGARTPRPHQMLEPCVEIRLNIY